MLLWKLTEVREGEEKAFEEVVEMTTHVVDAAVL